MATQSQKPRLVPLYFPSRDADFDRQINTLRDLLATNAEILPPVALGAPLPAAEAVVFPQMLGDAYRMLADFKRLTLPILVITSEFGTVSMWDWEICTYLRSAGVETIAPNSLDLTRIACKNLQVQRDLRNAKFLVFQDNPGEGFQPEIFKRFYWWEPECIQRMQAKFGFTVVKKSFRELAATAKSIPDAEADDAWTAHQDRLALVGGERKRSHTTRALRSALKLYLAVKREVEQDLAIRAVGINCLNESHFSDTTPCLAWELLHEEIDLTWGCEADLVSMLTMHLLHQALGTTELRSAIMMTNLYPFSMGPAALKHEHIPEFPDTDAPENHLLLAHCGYLGVLPRRYATEWALREKVLAIVDDNATAIDARLPVGDLTLAKLLPTFDQLSVVEANLEGYVQYPGSHCLNGAVVRVPDGPRLLETLTSHHYALAVGHHRAAIEILAKIFKLEIL